MSLLNIDVKFKIKFCIVLKFNTVIYKKSNIYHDQVEFIPGVQDRLHV